MANRNPEAVKGLQGGKPVESSAPTAQAAASPAGGTGAAAGGFDTAGNRDIAIATINNNRTRLEEIVVVLQENGLLPES